MINIKYFYPYLILFPLAILQLTIIPYFGYGEIKPDLITILVVYYSIQYGKTIGMINGFIIGLIFDLVSGGLIGISSFTKTIDGFIGGFFHNEEKNSEILDSFRFALVVFIAAVSDSFFNTFLAGSALSMNIFSIFIFNGLISGFYTAVVSTPLIFLKKKVDI